MGDNSNDIFELINSNTETSFKVDLDGDVVIGSDIDTDYSLAVDGVVMSMANLSAAELSSSLDNLDVASLAGYLVVTENNYLYLGISDETNSSDIIFFGIVMICYLNLEQMLQT